MLKIKISSFFKVKTFLLPLFLFLPVTVFAQELSDLIPVSTRENTPSRSNIQEDAGIEQGEPSGLLDCTDIIIWRFELDHTRVQIHRASDYSPIQVILHGFIWANHDLRWHLWAGGDHPFEPPKLYFVYDVMGQTGLQGVDIPLYWEISLNNGCWRPFYQLPNNRLGACLPRGPQCIRIRITGCMEFHQQDGYYRLQMEQCLLPLWY